MSGKTHLGALATAGVAALVLGSAAPASAAQLRHPPHFTEVDQVANQAGEANLTDADAVNSWGLALSPTSPLWVANNGTNTATL